MTETTPLFSSAFLMACWAQDYAAYCAGDADASDIIRPTNITPSVTAEKLLGELLKLKTTENAGLRQQILALDKKLDSLQVGIEGKEREMNAAVYGVAKDEILQVERR